MLSKIFSKISNKNEQPLRRIKDHYLYFYSSYPFCIRVRVVMNKLGLDIETRNIHQGTEHYEALQNGGGGTMVPCLRIDRDGETRWLYESTDIIKYLQEI